MIDGLIVLNLSVTDELQKLGKEAQNTMCRGVKRKKLDQRQVMKRNSLEHPNRKLWEIKFVSLSKKLFDFPVNFL